jgi:hemolysin activation/secretion protein
LRAIREVLTILHNVPLHWNKPIKFMMPAQILCGFAAVWFGMVMSASAQTVADEPPPVPAVAETPPGVSTNPVDRSQMLYIKEYRVIGSHQLNRGEIEKAVYPFMGPERTPDDVEHARAALEKAFQDKGFQTVSVQVPQQSGKRGIVFLQVTEAKIGRLSVEGARFFSIDAIKKKVPSLQPGKVPDFNKVSKEILALNQWSDRQVIPTLTPGFEPGTVDVDLKVKDTLPWHGSAEFNNRMSPGTPEYRLNLASSYDNLWQLGHSIGGSFQSAPEAPNQVLNWSVFYTARIPMVDWLKANFSYSSQNSVSTIGGGASLGNGNTKGFRLLAALPNNGEKGFSHNLSVGFDVMNEGESSQNASGANNVSSPVRYIPFRFNYDAVYAPETNAITIFDAGLSCSARGAIVNAQQLIGTNYGNSASFAAAQQGADAGFFIVKADLSHTHDLPEGFQIFGKVQGQYSPEPLIYSEQFAGGGLDTCRGYLEGTVAGDRAAFGSVELRSPLLLPGHVGINEWRVYTFFDGGAVCNVPVDGANRVSQYTLAAYGFGSRAKIFKDLNASLDVGVPLTSQPTSYPPTTNSPAPSVMAWSPLWTFRLFGEF